MSDMPRTDALLAQLINGDFNADNPQDLRCALDAKAELAALTKQQTADAELDAARAEAIAKFPVVTLTVEELYAWKAELIKRGYHPNSVARLCDLALLGIAARDAEPVAWVKKSEWDDAKKKRQSFNGWRQNYGDCDMQLFAAPKECGK